MRYLIIILWFLLGFFYWYSADKCCDPSMGAVSNVTEVVKDKALAFNWNSKNPIYGSTWNAYKDSILTSMKPNKVLEIRGLYSAEESNNSTYENLGLARADQGRLALGLTTEQVEMKALLVPTTSLDLKNKFESIRFNSLIRSEKVKEEIVKDDSGNISKRTTIYFPLNSTYKMDETEVEAYLDEVAKRVIASAERVQLVGHTDNTGSDKTNIVLGQRRADVIKDYLIGRGVSPSRIISSSKGESSPIASNDSETGQAKNRRTELTIIK